MSNESNTIYLLSIYGSLKPASLEASRSIHNQTAGAPESVAAARALGDLSHMVHVPIDHDETAPGDFLILDLWNNLDGLNQFFMDPHVQEGGGMIFSSRDPVVWAPAREFLSYYLPVPTGKNERYTGVVRGKVHSRIQAAELHNKLVSKTVNQARAAGNISHQAYFRLAAPETPEALEFFAVDTWFDMDGMAQHYTNPDFMKGFTEMFAEAPWSTVWKQPSGEWVEW